MVADTASIRAELEGLHNLPTSVREWRVEEGLDATDDPAVWVWAMIEHDDVDADTLRLLKALRNSLGRAFDHGVMKRVRDATGLWAYILIRGADETEVTG